MSTDKKPRNPKWQRDEIILALALYFDPERGPIDHRNPKVIALSKLLNELPIASGKGGKGTFRNANGVSLKLSNFLALDPDYKGKGMQSYSVQDEAIFNEFYNDRIRLQVIAEEIKAVMAASASLREELWRIEADEDWAESAEEGAVLYKLHKYRERDRKIVEQKKRQVLKRDKQLVCEVCGFDFFKMYGELGKDFIECHHTKPLFSLSTTTQTDLNDLALVCSNCHRMLHRRKTILSTQELKMLINVTEKPK